LTKSAFCKAVVTGRWVTRLIRMGNGKYRDATIHETWLLIGGDKTGDRRFSGHCLSANWRQYGGQADGWTMLRITRGKHPCRSDGHKITAFQNDLYLQGEYLPLNTTSSGRQPEKCACERCSAFSTLVNLSDALVT